jgi:hypothetical protein
MEKPLNDDNRNAVLLAFLSIPRDPSDGWKQPLSTIFVHANVNPSPSEVRGRNSGQALVSRPRRKRSVSLRKKLRDMGSGSMFCWFRRWDPGPRGQRALFPAAGRGTRSLP